MIMQSIKYPMAAFLRGFSRKVARRAAMTSGAED
jgi:hypothetical protein